MFCKKQQPTAIRAANAYYQLTENTHFLVLAIFNRLFIIPISFRSSLCLPFVLLSLRLSSSCSQFVLNIVRENVNEYFLTTSAYDMVNLSARYGLLVSLKMICATLLASLSGGPFVIIFRKVRFRHIGG